VNRILDKIDDANDKRWLARRLEHAHEPSLEQRLFEVFKALPLGLDKKDCGYVSLTSDQGNVTIGNGATIDVSATQQATLPSQGDANAAKPSIIIVEVLGYGGGSDGDRDVPAPSNDRRKPLDQQGYNPNGMFQIVGSGELTEEQKKRLTVEEKNDLSAK
jgi:hypothetical protein